MGVYFKNKKDDKSISMTSGNFSLMREVIGAFILGISYDDFYKNRQENYAKMKGTILAFWFKKSDLKGKFSEVEANKIVSFFKENKDDLYKMIGADKIKEEEELIFAPFINYLDQHKTDNVYYL